MGKNNNKNAPKENIEQGQTPPGKILASERKKQGVNEEQAADALKITLSRLKSIESDDFKGFPSETYVRGYLKNYCRFLNIDETAVLDSYTSINPPADPFSQESHEQGHSAHPSNHHKSWLVVYVVLVLLFLLWALSYWFLGSAKDTVEIPVHNDLPEEVVSAFENNSESDGNSVSASPISSIEADSGVEEEQLSRLEDVELLDEALEQAPETEEVLPQEEQLIEKSPAEQQVVVEQPIIVSKITAADLVKTMRLEEEPVEPKVGATTLVVEGDTLSFNFENPCWVKVTDVTGKVIFQGLQQSGSQLAVNGKAPFRVVVGNVEGTSLVYNGEPVQLNARSDGKALRLQVGG